MNKPGGSNSGRVAQSGLARDFGVASPAAARRAVLRWLAASGAAALALRAAKTYPAPLNYLRGVQFTDSAGQVRFHTVFPACYPGRYPHLHVEIFRRHRVRVEFCCPTCGANADFDGRSDQRLYRRGAHRRLRMSIYAVCRRYSRGRHTAKIMLTIDSPRSSHSPPHSPCRICASCAPSTRPDTARAESSAARRAPAPTVSSVPSNMLMPRSAFIHAHAAFL